MKKILFFIIATLLLVPADAAAKKKADISFAEQTYDFGTIPEKGGKVTHSFKFTNTGDANLVIVDASADCGCTVPEYAGPDRAGQDRSDQSDLQPVVPSRRLQQSHHHTHQLEAEKVRLKISGTVK